MENTRDTRARRGLWGVLAVCLVAGAVYLGIGLAKDEWELGVVGLGIMLVYGLVLVVTRRRSETMGLLAGDFSDERKAQIATSALAVTAQAMMLVVIGGFLYGLATDSAHTEVFSALAAFGAVVFAGSLFVLSRRR
jgi:hypothetical protein